MGLEDLTGASKFIDDLVNTNPASSDAPSAGDDHIRGVKNVLLNSFPGVTGAVTSTHTELNILDGVTATTAELNILDGVTSTTAELNILDGVTATAAELNKVDGLTATTAELNYVDGVTSAIQTQLDAKQADLAVPSLAEAQAGTSTAERVWTAQRVGQAIAALAPALGADDVTHTEIDWSLNTGGSWSINPSTSQVIPEGIYIAIAPITSASRLVSLQVYQGAAWRATDDTDSWYGGTIISDGTNVRLTQGASGATAVIYYLRLA